MDSASCTFSAEILELFIDELGQDLTRSECWNALQQCSLVSHAFRNRANYHLFSKIEFAQRPYSTPSTILSRLWKFRSIIGTGMTLPMTGILYNLRSFKLVMDGSVFEAYAILENEDLVEIIRNVLKFSKDIHTFTMQGSPFPIVWPDLTLEFRTVFKDLCRTATSLVTLNLENMVGVPHTLLMGTNIKHVCFHLIEFKKPRMAFVIFREGHLPKGQLESIDIDYTFPFPPTNLIESSLAYEDAMAHYQCIFSHVERLRYLIYRADDLQRFIAVARGISSSLKVVNLEISNSDNGFLRSLSDEIPFNDLHNLHRLIIRHKSLISTGTRHPLYKVATILQNVSVPPSLDTIELSFDVSSQPPWVTAVHFFPDPQTWALLDTALSHERFALVKKVTLWLKYCAIRVQPWTFDEKVFVSRCRESRKSMFPLLSASKTKNFTLVVSVNAGVDLEETAGV